jgi:hypothetical protein
MFTLLFAAFVLPFTNVSAAADEENQEDVLLQPLNLGQYSAYFPFLTSS